VAFKTSYFILERCVLFLEIAHPLAEPGNLADQLLDKLAKVVVREAFDTGGQHKKYESHPAPDVNREKILSRHPFGTDYPSGVQQTDSKTKFQTRHESYDVVMQLAATKPGSEMLSI